MQRGEIRDPIKVVIFSMLSCGIYAIYWQYMVCEEINKGLGRQQLEFVKFFVIGMFTCGLGTLYLMWQMVNAHAELQKSWGLQPKMEPPVMFALMLFVGPAAIFLMQQGLNETWQNGTPGGAGGYGTPGAM
jgi:hypothetical protein